MDLAILLICSSIKLDAPGNALSPEGQAKEEASNDTPSREGTLPTREHSTYVTGQVVLHQLEHDLAPKETPGRAQKRDLARPAKAGGKRQRPPH